MKTLMIKDLSFSNDLDAKALTEIRGGYGFAAPVFAMPKFDFAASKASFDATQLMSQSQNTLVNNGNNAAFVAGITSNVNPSQDGQNNINFG